MKQIPVKSPTAATKPSRGCHRNQNVLGGRVISQDPDIIARITQFFDLDEENLGEVIKDPGNAIMA